MVPCAAISATSGLQNAMTSSSDASASSCELRKSPPTRGIAVVVPASRASRNSSALQPTNGRWVWQSTNPGAIVQSSKDLGMDAVGKALGRPDA